MKKANKLVRSGYQEMTDESREGQPPDANEIQAAREFDSGMPLPQIVRQRRIHPRRLFELLGLSDEDYGGSFRDLVRIYDLWTTDDEDR